MEQATPISERPQGAALPSRAPNPAQHPLTQCSLGLGSASVHPACLRAQDQGEASSPGSSKTRPPTACACTLPISAPFLATAVLVLDRAAFPAGTGWRAKGTGPSVSGLLVPQLGGMSPTTSPKGLSGDRKRPGPGLNMLVSFRMA